MTEPTTAAGCTDEHAKFCSDCTTARLYNSIHCQDCGEGRPSAATTTAANWAGRPMFALDADVTVYWPDVRPCYEEIPPRLE